MSKIIIKGNITGNYNHFGDQYLSSVEEYLRNSPKELSATELELVNIIFQNTSSEEERKELLLNLREDYTDSPPKKSVWKPFIMKLIEKGSIILATKIADYIGESIDKQA